MYRQIHQLNEQVIYSLTSCLFLNRTMGHRGRQHKYVCSMYLRDIHVCENFTIVSYGIKKKNNFKILVTKENSEKIFENLYPKIVLEV